MRTRRLAAIGPGTLITTIIGALMVVALVFVYFYFLHTGRVHAIMRTVHGLGLLGVAFGIALMALASVLPVPSEFLSIFLLRFYGVIWGTLFSWVGGILGAVIALYASRWLARPIVERAAGRYLHKVQPWISDHGTFGLLIARFLPFVPYHLVNYAAGILRVRLWAFIWTTAVGTLPFQVALAGVYYGVSYGALPEGIAGVALFLVVVALGWRFRKRWFPDLH
ncbi:MAG: VTT domain-containing protein [Thermaerobacter sp.]|nr:VTT domain-containing protein [Thermaerobacter sp.]